MTARPSPLLTPVKLKQRLKALLDLWNEAGLTVGGVTVEGDRITILTVEAAANEQDEFKKWEQGAA